MGWAGHEVSQLVSYTRPDFGSPEETRRLVAHRKIGEDA
jgi:hypothetical protein